MTTYAAPTFAPLPSNPSDNVAERFATELFIRTCVMPSRDDSLSLIGEVADMDEQAASLTTYANHHLDRIEYVANYLWAQQFDAGNAATKGALRRSVSAALERAAFAWRMELDEAAERAATDADARIDAGDRLLGRAAALVA